MLLLTDLDNISPGKKRVGGTMTLDPVRDGRLANNSGSSYCCVYTRAE